MAFGQAELRQRRKEKVARKISGKWPPGTICTLLTRRKADNGYPAQRIAESGYRCIPPVGMFRPTFLP